jgi:tellurite resistance protein TerC
MLAITEITPWHWIGFIAVVLVVIAIDLGIFHRKAHVVQFKEALMWTFVWFGLAMAFTFGLSRFRTSEESLQFFTGYIIELSLSMDNVFVIAVIFSYFRVPLVNQHRVLFWGILGALIMRGGFIGVGVVLIQKFHWVLYVLALLVIYSGIKTFFSSESGVEPENNPVVRLTRKFFPVSNDFDGQKFLTRVNGRATLTPLALVLVMVETTDLVFALDSIPAIFAVTQKPFIVFTSNVFAILGLRSLYFVLANAINYFRFLKVGLSVVLIFIGLKMILPLLHEKFDFMDEVRITTSQSLLIIAGILLTSIIFSVVAEAFSARKRDK